MDMEYYGLSQKFKETIRAGAQFSHAHQRRDKEASKRVKHGKFPPAGAFRQQTTEHPPRTKRAKTSTVQLPYQACEPNGDFHLASRTMASASATACAFASSRRVTYGRFSSAPLTLAPSVWPWPRLRVREETTLDELVNTKLSTPHSRQQSTTLLTPGGDAQTKGCKRYR